MTEVQHLLQQFKALVESLPPDEAWSVAMLVEKVSKQEKERLLEQAVQAIENAPELAGPSWATLKVVKKVDTRYRDGDVKQALEAAGLPESSVYEWAYQRVMNPSKVDRLVRTGQLSAEVTAPRESKYIKAKIDIES